MAAENGRLWLPIIPKLFRFDKIKSFERLWRPRLGLIDVELVGHERGNFLRARLASRAKRQRQSFLRM
jgi:hypothetical protein